MENLTSFEDMSLHFVGEGGVLLDQARQRLYALNACATLIWCSLKDGTSAEEVSRSLAEQFALPADAAASYVAGVLRWHGSLGPHDANPQKPAPAETVRKPRRHAPGNPARVIEAYALLGSTLRVHYHSVRLFEAIHPLLQHCAAPDADAANAIDVVVRERKSGVSILAGHTPIVSSLDLADAATAVRACLTELATRASGGLCVVHAGALHRDGHGLLLPGAAGDGKSTLSAGLAALGFEMLCDDSTLLAGEPPQARSIPTGLCVKRGALEALAPHYPFLPSLPEWHRADGRHVRYLMPGENVRWAGPQVTAAIRWIVFPRYRPGVQTALLPLPRQEALARLLPGIYFLSNALDERNLARLIGWIECIDCFDLPLGSLDAATALIDDLCK